MDQAIQLLVQLPVVGIFVWFVLQIFNRIDAREETLRTWMVDRDKIIQDMLTSQRDEDREILRKIVATLEQISEKLSEHDKQAAVAIKDITRPIRRKGVGQE